MHNIFSQHYSICVLVANDWLFSWDINLLDPFTIDAKILPEHISTACLFREPSMSDCLVSVERKQRQNNKGK
jgi:hypothetical protein